MLLAPIDLSTYVGSNHLQQAIKVLKKNSLVHEFELYIFSNTPKPDVRSDICATGRGD